MIYTVSFEEKPELLIELDKSIDDMENGRVTPHAEAMEMLKKKYEEYVDQNS